MVVEEVGGFNDGNSDKTGTPGLNQDGAGGNGGAGVVILRIPSFA